MTPAVHFTGKKEMAPVYASSQAAGADLKADLEESVSLEPGQRMLVPTGIYMALPEGWEGQVRPRSGLAIKQGLSLLNSPGTIDADYRGEVKVILINLGQETVIIEPGQRIAQLVVAPVRQAVFNWMEKLPGSERGSGGFGSTGK